MPDKKKKPIKKKKSSELEGARVKLRFRKHILPPLAGLLVFLLVFGFFNSEYLSGRIAYYLYERHANVAALDTSTASSSIDKNAPPKVIINKINVNAPVIFDQTTVNEANFQKALQHGTVHYPNTAVPGQQGNVVIFGHSSGQWWAPGNYKFVFTLLNKLQYGDTIFVEYQGVRYIYRVSNISVVKPDDLSVLNQGGNSMLTLITCTPVGTSQKRLIVQAQQIVPKPASALDYNQAAKAPQQTTSNLPASSPSFWTSFKELFN
jgi:sortase A